MDPQYAYASAPMNTFPMRVPPVFMAEGGLAAAARQVQSKGRDGDSMLVHMAPGEVKGLQALAMAHGGSLTINPTTGLPEASFLRAILPMVAGFALGPAGFGLMSAPMAGLTVGALTTAATGSLKKGLMAGLGAYGGAGIGEGLVSAGGGVPSGGTAAANVTAEQAANYFGGPQAANAPGALFGSAPAAPVTAPAITPAGIGPGINPGVDFFKQTPLTPGPATAFEFGYPSPAMPAAAAAPAPVTSLPPEITNLPSASTGTAASRFETAGKGLKEMFQPGEAGKAARATFGKSLPFGTTAAAGISGISALTPEPKKLSSTDSYLRPYEFAWNPNTGAYEPSPVPGDTSERRYLSPTFTPLPIQRAAQGGEITDPTDEMTQDGGYAEGGLSALAKKRKSLSGDKYYAFADDRRDKSMEAAIEQNFAKGGLGQALPPRFLSGGGDGMSDSIKANIDGVQEARLADGEFVVPADVVSHLGNGSSKAGAKKLYAMMDKIRKARTGTKRQAPEVNAARYMPA